MSFSTTIGIFIVCCIICLIGMFISAVKEDTHIEIVFATLTVISSFFIVVRTFLEMIE